jgi:D-hexose-6-phosphate mutarotase
VAPRERRPPPAEEPRRQLGARIRISLAERLRDYMHYERESQQEVVEAALHAYLTLKGY